MPIFFRTKEKPRQWKAGGLWRDAIRFGWKEPQPHDREGWWERDGTRVLDTFLNKHVAKEMRLRSEWYASDPITHRLQEAASRARETKREIGQVREMVNQWYDSPEMNEMYKLIEQSCDGIEDLAAELLKRIGLKVVVGNATLPVHEEPDEDRRGK